MTDLTKLRALCEAAAVLAPTGLTVLEDDAHEYMREIVINGTYGEKRIAFMCHEAGQRDDAWKAMALLFAESLTALPDLIDEVETLRSLLLDAGKWIEATSNGEYPSELSPFLLARISAALSGEKS